MKSLPSVGSLYDAELIGRKVRLIHAARGVVLESHAKGQGNFVKILANEIQISKFSGFVKLENPRQYNVCLK